jgi:flagellar secretion chaperone FliS
MESELVSPYSQQSMVAAYRSVSAHGAVADADPHTLVLTVLDATLARLSTARACIEHKEIRRKAGLLHSAVILIAELRGSLDLAKGGQLAQNLSDLYEYMTRRLIHANLNNDVAAVAEVAGLLGEIREAWAAIGPQVRQSTPDLRTSAA